MAMGKQAIWKAVNKKTEFGDLFASLGSEVAPSEKIVRALEKFVCFVYGHPRLQSVNETREKSSGKSSASTRKLSTLA